MEQIKLDISNWCMNKRLVLILSYKYIPLLVKGEQITIESNVDNTHYFQFLSYFREDI